MDINLFIYIYIYIYIWHSRRESARRTYLKKTQSAAMGDRSIYTCIYLYIYIAISLSLYAHAYIYVYIEYICMYKYIYGAVVECVRSAHT